MDTSAHTALDILLRPFDPVTSHLATDHDLPLRTAAGVSSDCLNRVYDQLRGESSEFLGRMWNEADPWTPAGALLRHQIAFVMRKRRDGHWLLTD